MSEYQLNTNALMIEYDQYMAEANLFIQNFAPGSQSFTEIQTEGVLYESLMDVMNEMVTTGMSSGTYISGLRIAYGLSHDTIRLYYAPVFGVYNSVSNGKVHFDMAESTGDMLSIIASGESPVYGVSNGTLYNIMESDTAVTKAISDITSYRENIVITSGTSTHGYQNGVDGKSVYVPFQEMTALADEYSSDIIFFTSATSASGSYKHSIIMSHLDPLDNAQFEGTAANFSNVCPPMCPTVSYPAAQ